MLIFFRFKRYFGNFVKCNQHFDLFSGFRIF